MTRVRSGVWCVSTSRRGEVNFLASSKFEFVARSVKIERPTQEVNLQGKIDSSQLSMIKKVKQKDLKEQVRSQILSILNPK